MTTHQLSEVAQRLQNLWSLGDYARVAHDVIPHLGATLVDAVDVQPGQRVLDVAAGAGNAAIPAAARGAEVVASDLVPSLLDAGRAAAAERGVDLAWEVADAQDLPYDDASFDVVMSCVGSMFAPFHQSTADEMLRVCRPGGRVAHLSWTPQGYVGQLFAALKPYAPAPLPGAQPPPLWGDEDHAAALFGDGVRDVRAERGTVTVDCFTEPSQFRTYFGSYYGPTVAIYRSLADDPERKAALDAELDALAARHLTTSPDGRQTMEWEYLLWTAERA